jgi:hypothetical protein
MTKSLKDMSTFPGMSVRKEIEIRLAQAQQDARSAALEEAIVFLGTYGFLDAAEALQHAAFGGQEGEA